MTDDKTDTNEVESAGTHSLLRAEHHIIRLTFWQTILSVVGIVIAVLALYAALTESAAVRQQTAAAVWPFVQLMIEDYDTGDAAGFSFAFTNAGVGPARMQDVRVSVDGVVTRNWSELVASVDGDPGAAVNRNFISDRVLRTLFALLLGSVLAAGAGGVVVNTAAADADRTFNGTIQLVLKDPLGPTDDVV